MGCRNGGKSTGIKSQGALVDLEIESAAESLGLRFRVKTRIQVVPDGMVASPLFVPFRAVAGYLPPGVMSCGGRRPTSPDKLLLSLLLSA